MVWLCDMMASSDSSAAAPLPWRATAAAMPLQVSSENSDSGDAPSAVVPPGGGSFAAARAAASRRRECARQRSLATARVRTARAGASHASRRHTGRSARGVSSIATAHGSFTRPSPVTGSSDAKTEFTAAGSDDECAAATVLAPPPLSAAAASACAPMSVWDPSNTHPRRCKRVINTARTLQHANVFLTRRAPARRSADDVTLRSKTLSRQRLMPRRPPLARCSSSSGLSGQPLCAAALRAACVVARRRARASLVCTAGCGPALPASCRAATPRHARAGAITCF